MSENETSDQLNLVAQSWVEALHSRAAMAQVETGMAHILAKQLKDAGGPDFTARIQNIHDQLHSLCDDVAQVEAANTTQHKGILANAEQNKLSHSSHPCHDPLCYTPGLHDCHDLCFRP